MLKNVFVKNLDSHLYRELKIEACMKGLCVGEMVNKILHDRYPHRIRRD